MKITPAILPHELLIFIDQSLSREDLFACMFVSRQWNVVFSRLFYKSVTIQSLSACIKFHRTLCESVELHAQPIGHVVKSLCFRQHNPPAAVMQHIPTLCPSLVRFEFCKAEDQLVNYCKGELDPDTVHVPMLIPDRAVMSRLLFTHYSKLALDHLALECYSGIENLRFLSAMPQLSSISLNWKGKWRTEDMDVIHSVCPRLEAIQIKAPVFECDGVHKTVNNEFTTVPATRVKKVHLRTDRGLSAAGYTPWTIYFSRKYPNLEELSLCCGFDTQAAYDVFPADGHRPEEIPGFLFSPNVREWRRAREETHKQAYRLFFTSCPRLRSLRLTNMRLYRGFFEELVASREHHANLTHLAVHDELLFPARDLPPVIHTFRNTLVSLSLFFEYSDDDNYQRGTPPNVPLLVSQLPQLEHLTLGDMRHISLKAILDHAPRLKSLTIVHVRFRLAREENQMQTYPCVEDAPLPLLETLTIKSSPLSQKLLDHITRRCPRLKHFALESCGVYDAPNGRIVIDLSQQHLQTLKLDGLVFKNEDGFLRYYTGGAFSVRTFALQFTTDSVIDNTLWYDTGVAPKEHQPPANDTVIGIRPLNQKRVMALMPQLVKLRRNPLRLERVPCAGYVHIQCQAVNEFWANGMRLLKFAML